MAQLKRYLTEAPALISINYEEDTGLIILAVDASLEGWGAILMQEILECRGVLIALKKVRAWLYGVHFILETDARVLAAQLNQSGADLPGALMTK